MMDSDLSPSSQSPSKRNNNDIPSSNTNDTTSNDIDNPDCINDSSKDVSDNETCQSPKILNDNAAFTLTSPNAIAEAVLEQAMKDCKKSIPSSSSSWNDDSNGDNANVQCSNRRIDDDGDMTDSMKASNVQHRHKKQKTNHHHNNQITTPNEASIEQINQIWKSINNEDNDDDSSSSNYNDRDDSIFDDPSLIDDALDKTKQIMYEQLESIIRSGLEVFHKNDSLKRELKHAKDLCESRKREIQRLKSSEVDTRASLSNLLQAVEMSKSNARDASRAAQTEARLRSEIASMRSERDVALGTNAEMKRKSNLLEEEVRMLKSRVARLTQDKIKIERESRAALGLARSMDSHVASDVEFYRRKVSDLNDHLHSKNTVISELKQQLDSYKRDMERSLSQNRLAQIRRRESRKR